MSTSDYTLTSRVELNDGNSYPRLGLGVYESEPGEETFNAVLWALQAGYRHIDGAEWYENEADCGRAIKHFISTTSVLRSEIYFTTKLMHNKSREWVTEAVKISLEKSGLDYIDLYLVHDPNGGEEIRNEVWKGCCDVKDLGLVKSIGVSNFGVVHLEQLLASKPKYIPAVNQVDLHPFMTRSALVAFYTSHNIILEAWAPLVRGQRFQDPTIVKLSSKYNKTPAQILIRWGLEKGFIVIPKSIKKDRIESNKDVFDFVLEKEDVESLSALDEFLITDWEVTTVP